MQLLSVYRKGVRKTKRLLIEGEEGEGIHEKQKGCEDFAVRRWEGEGTHEKQKGSKSRGCNRGFLWVFSLEGLGLGFKLELNLEEVGFMVENRLEITLVLLVFLN